MGAKESTDPKDYRQGFRAVFTTYRWVWRELLGDTGRRKAKIFILLLCCSTLISMSIPWFLGEMSMSLEELYRISPTFRKLAQDQDIDISLS